MRCFFALFALPLLVQLGETGPPYNATLLHPRSGDVAFAGRNYVVTWTIDNSFSDLNLYILGGGYNLEIASGIPNSGSWEWNIETNWPSSINTIYMVLDRVDWNTNNEISPFQMVALADQTRTPEACVPSHFLTLI